MHRLVYFAVPGRAEACRIALAFSGLQWEDIEVNGERFPANERNWRVAMEHVTGSSNR